jgi:hypothetical protein
MELRKLMRVRAQDKTGVRFMAEFIRGTTPSFSVTLGDGVRFSELGTVIFRFSQFGLHVDKHPTISEDGLQRSVR